MIRRVNNSSHFVSKQTQIRILESKLKRLRNELATLSDNLKSEIEETIADFMGADAYLMGLRGAKEWIEGEIPVKVLAWESTDPKYDLDKMDRLQQEYDSAEICGTNFYVRDFDWDGDTLTVSYDVDSHDEWEELSAECLTRLPKVVATFQAVSNESRRVRGRR